MKKLLIGLVIMQLSFCNAQTMNKVKKISKKEVQILFADKKLTLHDSLTEKLNLKIYSTGQGNIVLVRDDGKGFLWESINDFNTFQNDDNAVETTVFNMVGWINKEADITILCNEAKQKLSSYLNKQIDFSEASLKEVNKIKVKDIAQEKEIFYSIILYSCGYYQNKYGGITGKRQRQDSKDYEPIITDDKGRNYTPYWEYMKNMQEQQKVSLIQSIELERIKYNLQKN